MMGGTISERTFSKPPTKLVLSEIRCKLIYMIFPLRRAVKLRELKNDKRSKSVSIGSLWCALYSGPLGPDWLPL